MSTAAPKPDHRTLPRKKRPPSDRDQALYVARHTRAWSQAKLAEEFHLSQPRVSQILQRVAQWRAGFGPRAAGELDHAGQQRLERFLARERYQSIYDRAIREFDAAPKELTASKSGERDGKKFSEESRREVQRPAGLMRIALRASENLAKAAELPAPPPPRDPEAQERERKRIALDWLNQQRREAEEAGRVAKTVPHQCDNFNYLRTVEHWLGALVGEKPPCPAKAIHFGPGTPLAELSRFYFPAAAVGWDKAAAAAGPPSSGGQGSGGQGPDANGGPALADSLVPPYETASNPFNPNVDDTSQVIAEEQVATIPPPTKTVRGTPEPGLVPAKGTRAVPAQDDAAERRRLHMERLEQLKQARRRGRPHDLFVFDPADGPLPPPCYILDGAEP